MAVVKPNFFIVGAPKCGTTAMHQYLSEHPQVYMSRLKEPHYFAFDLPGYRVVTGEGEYLRNFKAVNREVVVGESSVHYLYSSEAIRRIAEFDRNARLLIMVRKPVEMLKSYHLQMIRSRNEDREDFNVAWTLSAKRRRGEDIPRLCKDRKVLYYDQVAKYGTMLSRVLQLIPASQVKVTFFDDFMTRPEDVYRSILAFLGVDHDGRKEFQRINRAKTIRWTALADFTENPPRWASLRRPRVPERYAPLTRRVKKAFGVKKVGVLPFLRWVNQVESSPLPLSAATRQAIREEYRDDIALLSRLTSRNLEHWI
jgi:hypothetical protein